MGRPRGIVTEKDIRVNVQLKKPEDIQAYYDLKGLAAMHEMTLQEAVISGLHMALTLLRKRTLPPHTVLRLSKKKGRVTQQGEE